MGFVPVNTLNGGYLFLCDLVNALHWSESMNGINNWWVARFFNSGVPIFGLNHIGLEFPVFLISDFIYLQYQTECRNNFRVEKEIEIGREANT